jgi:heme exporter protein B
MWREARLVAGKDLRVEWRSRVAMNQVVPFAVVVLLLFAFALDPDRGFLRRAAPGLYWVAVLLSALVVIQRAFATETVDGGRDGLRVAGLDPAAIFLGKAAAVGGVLLALEAILAGGVALLYGATFGDAGGIGLVVLTCLLATVGIVAPGMIYGALASGVRIRETLLPLLFLPAVAPVMIGATRSFEAAINHSPSEGWRWCGLLGVFAVAYTALGLAVFEPLLEDS